MKITRMVGNFLLLFFVTLSVAPAQSAEEFEVEGLLLDRTLSMVGKNFFSQFTQVWQNIPAENEDAIVIVESCTGTTGNLVFIRYQNRIIFQKRLEPRKRTEMQDVRKIALLVLQRIQDLKQNNFPADLQGDGI